MENVNYNYILGNAWTIEYDPPGANGHLVPYTNQVEHDNRNRDVC